MRIPYCAIVFSLLVLSLGSVRPATAQGAATPPRVPSALRPSAPTAPKPTASPSTAAATPRTTARTADTTAVRVQRSDLAKPATFAVPGVVFAGDASLHARGLGGPTRSGISAMIPLAFVLGHFTPYLSVGAVGDRWLPDSMIVAPSDSFPRLPLTFPRRSLTEPLSDSTPAPFIGAGVGVKVGAVGVSGEVRNVKRKGIEQQVRGKVKF